MRDIGNITFVSSIETFVAFIQKTCGDILCLTFKQIMTIQTNNEFSLQTFMCSPSDIVEVTFGDLISLQTYRSSAALSFNYIETQANHTTSKSIQKKDNLPIMISSKNVTKSKLPLFKVTISIR